MRRGWTLVEVLVACVLMTMVLSGVWLMFTLGDRSRGVTATARALQTATLIQEYVTNDLARMISVGEPLHFEPETEKGRKLGFYVVDGSHVPPSGEVGVRAVLYQLTGDNKLMEREYDKLVSTIGSSPLVDAQFRPFHSTVGMMVRVVLTVGRTKDDPEGPPYIHTFLVRPDLRGSSTRLPVKPLSEFINTPAPTEGAGTLPIPPGMFSQAK